MKTNRASFAGGAASSTSVDLSTLEIGAITPAADNYVIADYDVEVVGNDAAVTLKGKGPFSTSVLLDITDGSFAIGGGKISIQGFCFSEFEFTTAGSAYTINITRQIQ